MRLFATTLALLVIVAASLPLSSSRAQPQAQYGPVTLDIAFSVWDSLNPDPQLAATKADFELAENLFIGLTDYRGVRPELAQAWTVSPDGLTWSFTLREDVNWVRYDPATEAIEIMRRVVAADVVYGIKRGCRPNRDEDGKNFVDGTLLAKVIAGCDVLNAMPDSAMTEALVQGDTVKVRAPSDTLVEIELLAPAAYLPALTSLPIMRPVPPEIIAAHGSAWLDVGQMWTSGPYVMSEDTAARRVFRRNPVFPAGAYGNIDQVNLYFIEDGGTAYALMMDNQLDQAHVPQAETMPVYTFPPDKHVLQIPSNAVYYFGFNLDKPPFDNVHVRRAFNAMFDRQAFIEQIRGGLGIPMLHLTPPVCHSPLSVSKSACYVILPMPAAKWNWPGIPTAKVFQRLILWRI